MFGEDGGFEPGGAGTMPFLQNFQNFGAVSGGEDNSTTSEGTAEKAEKSIKNSASRGDEVVNS